MTTRPVREFDASLYLPLRAGRAELVLDEVVSLLRALDPIIGGFQLKYGEDQRRGPTFDGAEDITPYVTSDFGFMAISKLASVEVLKDRPPRSGVQDGIKVSMHLKAKAEPKVEAVVRQLESLAATVGFVCGWACGETEERHHLFADFKLPKGRIQSYVGRDHRTWVPGLFWWNCWSLAWVEEHGVDLANIPSIWAVTRHELGPTPHAIVRCSLPWQEWSRYAGEARAWANATPGVFSIDEVKAGKPANLDDMSAIRYLRQWG